MKSHLSNEKIDADKDFEKYRRASFEKKMVTISGFLRELIGEEPTLEVKATAIFLLQAKKGCSASM